MVIPIVIDGKPHSIMVIYIYIYVLKGNNIDGILVRNTSDKSVSHPLLWNDSPHQNNHV